MQHQRCTIDFQQHLSNKTGKVFTVNEKAHQKQQRQVAIFPRQIPRALGRIEFTEKIAVLGWRCRECFHTLEAIHLLSKRPICRRHTYNQKTGRRSPATTRTSIHPHARTEIVEVEFLHDQQSSRCPFVKIVCKWFESWHMLTDPLRNQT